MQVELTVPVAEKHLREMRSAAESMTDEQSVRVAVVGEDPKAMLAEFTMPKDRRMDVADKIMHGFALFMEDYSTQSVGFPHPQKKKRTRRKPDTESRGRRRRADRKCPR